MGMAIVDPEMLDRLAASLEAQARSIPGIKKRAAELRVADEVAGLNPLLSYLVDTASDLRGRARGLRAPSTDPALSPGLFGLPAPTAQETGAGDLLAKSLHTVLNTHASDTPAARAQAVKDYFATLTPDQQSTLALTEPGVIGNLDGVPVGVRYAANRVAIQKEYGAESAYLAQLGVDRPEFKRTKARVDTLRGFLNPREKTGIDPTTNRIVTVEFPRQFLVFDPASGSVADPKATPYPDGRVAEVVGDLENAKNVAFRIPGITNRLDNYDGFGRGGYDLVADPSKKGAERTDTAVVSWLGYDTPELGDSVDPAKAKTGGKALADFRSGISVNLRPDATLDVFAHSYGTLVTSKALQFGMQAKSVAFMGSPGLGPNIHSVADFHMPGTTFYALRAPADMVSYTQGLGDDPADFEDITRLGTAGPTGQSHGHSQYYTPGTGSLANLQEVLFGDPENLTFTRTTLDEEMPGAAEVRELVSFLHARVPEAVTVELGGGLDPVLQDLQAGRISYVDAVQPICAALDRSGMLDLVKPADLLAELVALGAAFTYKSAYSAATAKGLSPAEAAKQAAAARSDMLDIAVPVRDLVVLLQARVPLDVVGKITPRIYAGVQELTGGHIEQGFAQISDTFNEYNLFDRVPPGELRDKVVLLAGNFAGIKAYEVAKAHGATEIEADSAAVAAAAATTATLFAVTLPVVKALEADRLLNNLSQLTVRVGADGLRVAGDGWKTLTAVSDDGLNVVGDMGDTLLHPTHVMKDTGDVFTSFADAGDTVVSNSADALDATFDAGRTTLHKGADVVKSAGSLINPFD